MSIFCSILPISQLIWMNSQCACQATSYKYNTTTARVKQPHFCLLYFIEQGCQVIKNKTLQVLFFYRHSNFIKIMNTLHDQKYDRSEKYKRQDYGRHTIDEAKDYKSRVKQPQQRESYRSEADSSQFYHARQSYPEANYDNEGLLPPIRIQNKQSLKPQALAMRLRGEDDKTQIYLKNCEYIIKNLREMKQKKEKDHYLTMSTEPTPKEERQIQFSSKQEVQYYPKSQQFSSQGKPYNKLSPVETSQKYKTNVKKLQDDGMYKSYEYESPNVRVKSLPRKVIKNITINKYQMEPDQDKNHYGSERQVREDDQSDIPSGFEERRKEPKPYRRFSSSKTSERNTPRITKTVDSRERQVQKEDKLQKQRQQKQQQNIKVQKELISCLSELTQFLRNQNQNTNKQENKPPQQITQPIKQNQKEMQPSNTSKSNNEIPQQPQSQNTARNSKTEEKEDQHKAETLKEKAIVALKKLNQKSKGFVELASNRNQPNKQKEEHKDEPLINKKKPSVKFVEDIEHVPTKQQQSNTNPQKANQQKTLKPINAIPVEQKASQNQNPSTSKLPATNSKIDQPTHNEQQTQKQGIKQPKSESLNSELAKQLVSYLQKQQNQNIQLSFCLKELTQFLKIQNQQMVQMKTSRHQQQKPMRKTLSPQKQTIQTEKIEEQEEEEQQQQVQKGKTSKLQQAVLNKLKKARLRGNIFKEKVQSFRKSHHLIITKRETHQKQQQKQEQKEVQIQPVTNNPKNTESDQIVQQEGQPSPVNRQKQLTVQNTKP